MRLWSREKFVCVWGKWVGVLTKKIREDFSVTEILIERRVPLYRDLGQSSPSSKNQVQKSWNKKQEGILCLLVFMVLDPFSMIHILKT